jgi:hypothetical protein
MLDQQRRGRKKIPKLGRRKIGNEAKVWIENAVDSGYSRYVLLKNNLSSMISLT